MTSLPELFMMLGHWALIAALAAGTIGGALGAWEAFIGR